MTTQPAPTPQEIREAARSRFLLATSPSLSATLMQIGVTAMRQTQREIDEQAERFSEAQRGKYNFHNSKTARE